MRKLKSSFALFTLFTAFVFSSCTNLNDETEFIENSETQTAEKIMR